MGDHRNGPAALRTPLEARRDLTLPVIAILQKKATPVYPLTSLMGRSGVVGIFAVAGGGGLGRQVGLPIWVDPDQWERCVRPVLEDPRWRQTLPWVLMLRSTGQTGLLEEQIGAALEMAFRSAGYGPSTEENHP